MESSSSSESELEEEERRDDVVPSSSNSHTKINAPHFLNHEAIVEVLIREGELGLLKVLHSRLHERMVVTHTIDSVEGYIKDPESEMWVFVEGWYLKE